ncbi:MAG: [protein-PII] uridylyltransferase [Candidatus Binatia bacterium]
MILASTPETSPLSVTTSLPPVDGAVDAGSPLARRFIEEARTEVRSRHEAGASGRAVVAVYTEAIDHLVRFLYGNATLHFQARHPLITQRCAIVAQGGYGRGELNPFSDIDLLVLYPWKVTPYVETVADAILYPLWDGGLQVGHALRNVRECASWAARDMKAKTAILDARYLCGDESVFAEFDAEMREHVWSASQATFVREKLAESAERHEKAGDSIYLLQPQLKDGKGGLRDLHTALWMAKVRFRVRTFRELITCNVLSEREVQDLEEALDFLWRVRNGMHLASGTHQDLLTFELQEALAPSLGFGPGREGREGFMRAYYRHATMANRVSEAVIDRCVRSVEPYRGRLSVRTIRDGMRIVRETLTVTGRQVFEHDPATLVEVFLESQRHHVGLAEETQELIRDSVALLEPVRDDPRAARAFRAIVRANHDVAGTLSAMHRLGVLNVLVPEFAHLECLISHDPFHVYTVDHHTLVGVREIERLRDGEFIAALPHLTEVVRELPQPEILMMGMLFHDIGKGWADNHPARGARMMQALGTRLGLHEDEIAATEFLVREHLTMSHLAQHRDVDDERLVIDFCRTCGNVEGLQRLYVLTYADMRSVAPGVWNNWRGTLVTELYVRAREVFERGDFVPEDRGARANRIRGRLRTGVPGAAQAAVERLTDAMPDSYFLSTPEDAMVEHAELVRRLEQREAEGEAAVVVMHWADFPERDSAELAICTRDRPGLFAMITGVLASEGLNILAARIATSRDGVALDAFRISRPSEDGDLDQERWERVGETLRDVLRHGVDVEELVRRSARPWLMRRRGRPVQATVEIDNSVSDAFTVLDVTTADRVGLLFTITNCLYHLWVQIHLAKVTTMVTQALDAFYVTDPEGRKIEDPAQLERIRTELLRALDDEDEANRSAAAGG